MIEVEGFFMMDLMNVEWFDVNGNKIFVCFGDEVWVFIQVVFDWFWIMVLSYLDFLINFSVLVGGGYLMLRKSLKVVKLVELEDWMRYKIYWQFRYGSVVGDFSMEEEVMYVVWKRKKKDGIGGGRGVVDWE